MFHDEKLMRHKRVKGLWLEANRLADGEEDFSPMPSICNTLQHLINREYENPTDCLSLRTSSMLLNGATHAYRKKVQSLFADTEKLDKDVRLRHHHHNPDQNSRSTTDTESINGRSIRNEMNSSVITGQEPETMMRMDRKPLEFDVSPILSQHKRKSSMKLFIYESPKKPRLQRLSLTPRYSSSSSEHQLRRTRSKSLESRKPGSPRSGTKNESDPELHQNFPDQNSVTGLLGSCNSPDKSILPGTSAIEEQSEGIQTNSSSSQVASPTNPSSEHLDYNGIQTTPTRETSPAWQHVGRITNTPSQEHETPSRQQIGTQTTPSTEQIGTQTTLSREHVSTQFTPLVEHIGTEIIPSTRHQYTQTGFQVPPDVHLPFAQIFIFATSRVDPCMMIEGHLSDFGSDEDEKY